MNSMNDHQLEIALDRAIEQLHSGAEETAVISNAPTDIEPLLQLATELKTLNHIQPSAQFKTQSPLKIQRLISQPAQQKSLPQISRWERLWRTLFFNQRRILVPLLGVCLLLWFLGGGLALAQRAIPGETLYPIKTLSESVQLRWTQNEAQLHLKFANRRWQETAELAHDVQYEYIAESLTQYETHLTAVSQQLSLESGLSEAEKQQLSAEIIPLLSQHRAELALLAADLPTTFSQQLQRVSKQVDTLLDSSSTLPTQPSIPAVPPAQTPTPLPPTQTAPSLPSATPTVGQTAVSPTPLIPTATATPPMAATQKANPCYQYFNLGSCNLPAILETEAAAVSSAEAVATSIELTVQSVEATVTAVLPTITAPTVPPVPTIIIPTIPSVPTIPAIPTLPPLPNP